MYFDDRLDAGRQLADALRKYGGKNPLVLAIPRRSFGAMGRFHREFAQVTDAEVMRIPAARERRPASIAS